VKIQKTYSKLALLWLASVFLTLLSFISGAPFFRVLRENYGAKIFWISAVVTVLTLDIVGAQALSLIIGAVWMIVGVYYELEIRGVKWWSAAWISVGLSTLYSIVQGLFLMKQAEITNSEQLSKAAHRIIEQINTLYPQLKLNSETILYQIPSGFLAILIFALGLSIIGGPAVSKWFNLNWVRRAGHVRGLDFRVPDYLTWFGLMGLLLMLVDFKSVELSILGSSLINVLTAVYFFQGLAIFEVFLIAIRAGPFTRLFSYFLIVGNLFFILSLIGFIDFWIDFRRRLRKLKPVSNT